MLDLRVLATCFRPSLPAAPAAFFSRCPLQNHPATLFQLRHLASRIYYCLGQLLVPSACAHR